MKRLTSILSSIALLLFHFQAFAEDAAVTAAAAETARLEREQAQTQQVNQQVLAKLQEREKAERPAVDVPESEEDLASDYSLAAVAEQVELCKDPKGGWKKGTVTLPGESEPFECSHLTLLEYELLRAQAGDTDVGEHAALMCATRGWEMQDKMDFAKQLKGMGQLKYGLDQHFNCPSKTESWGTCIKDVGCNILKSGMAVATLGTSKILEVFGVPMPGCSNTSTKSDCLTEAVWGVWKDLVSNVEGIWDIAKMGWNAVKGVASKAWGWVSSWWSDSEPVEDSTSIKQAFIENQPESFFSKFLKNPLGTFTDMMGNFLSSMGSYVGDAIQDNFGCAEWADSRLTNPINPPVCKKPIVSWGCASCSQKMNMACGVAGFLGGEVLLAFLTGGVVNAASKSAKLAAVGSKLKIAGTFASKYSGLNFAMKGFSAGGRVGMGIMTRAGNMAVKIGGKIYKMHPKKSEMLLKVLRGGKAALNVPGMVVRKYLDVMEDAFVLGVSGREGLKQLKAARAALKTESGLRAAKTAGMSEAAVAKFDDLARANDEIRAAQKRLIDAAKNGKKTDDAKAAYQAAQKNLDEAYQRYGSAKTKFDDQLKADELLKRQQLAQARAAEQKAREAEKARLAAEQKARDLAEAERKLAEQRRIQEAQEAQRRAREAEAVAKRERELLEAQRKAQIAADEAKAAQEAAAKLRAQQEAQRAKESRVALLTGDTPKSLPAPKVADDAADASRAVTKVDDAADTSVAVAKVDDVTDASRVVTKTDDVPVVALKSESPVKTNPRGRSRGTTSKPKVEPKAVDDVASIGAKDDLVEINTIDGGSPLRGRIVESSPNGITIKQADGTVLSVPARNLDLAKAKNLYESQNISGLNIAKPGDQLVLTTRSGAKVEGQVFTVNDKSVTLMVDGKKVNVRNRDLDLGSVKVQRAGEDLGTQAYLAADRTTDAAQAGQATGSGTVVTDDVADVVGDTSRNLPVLYKGDQLPVPAGPATKAATGIADDVMERLGPYSMMNNKTVDVITPPGTPNLKGARLVRSKTLDDGSIVHGWEMADGTRAVVNVTENNLILDMRELAKGRVRYIKADSSEAVELARRGRMMELRAQRRAQLTKTDDGLPLLPNRNKPVALLEDLRKKPGTKTFLLEDGRKVRAQFVSHNGDLIELRLMPSGRLIKVPWRKIALVSLIGKAAVNVALEPAPPARLGGTGPTAGGTTNDPAAGPAPVVDPARDPAGDPAKDPVPATSVIDDDDFSNSVNAYKYDPTKGGRAVQMPRALIIPPDTGFVKGGAW